MLIDREGRNRIYRVMVVDDSAVIRHAITRILEKDTRFKIVATAGNGEVAVDKFSKTEADVIILDIEMPLMDGLTAIPKLKAIDPGVQIIMASTLTTKNAEISLKAMAAGATDYIPKPSNSASNLPDDFAQELIEKVVTLGNIARKLGVRQTAVEALSLPEVAVRPETVKNLTLRTNPIHTPEIIALCASTGGPEALIRIIKEMGHDLSQPIVITQHMPPTFTSILAANISRQCDVTCVEASEGMKLEAGTYYVAPGDYHLLVTLNGFVRTAKIVQTPKENYCRPAADPMLRSVAESAGRKALVVILTGMGQDGLKGSENIVSVGGSVLAQDEATSVVWGMPGAVARAGLCTKILPLGEIGANVHRIATGKTP